MYLTEIRSRRVIYGVDIKMGKVILKVSTNVTLENKTVLTTKWICNLRIQNFSEK